MNMADVFRASVSILRFDRLSPCIEAYWFRLHGVWFWSHRLLFVQRYKHVPTDPRSTDVSRNLKKLSVVPTMRSIELAASVFENSLTWEGLRCPYCTLEATALVLRACRVETSPFLRANAKIR